MLWNIVLIVGLAVLVLIAAAIVYAWTQPNDFRVQRSASITAPPEKILPHIADFRAWPAWSPYEKLDPAMTRSVSGAPSGKGAIYTWKGNSKAGAGRMEIIDVIAPSKVTIKLDFQKPFEAHNTAEFTLVPRGETTDVVWAMFGPRPFIAKLMGIVFSMDAMIGKDFETGLANLKALAEK